MFNIAHVLFKVSYENVRLSHRKFFIKSEKSTNRLEAIGKAFLDGYHHALKSRGREIQNLDNGRLLSGFNYEGASMACSLVDFLRLKKNSRLNELMHQSAGSKHIYMLHVGAGWAYARLPINVERKIQSFDPLLRWLIVDGYGFHQAYFKTQKYVYDRAEPKELKSEFAKHVFYQGLGRCLWFVDGTDIDRIANRIIEFPEVYIGDLWAGVGLAAAYAGGVDQPEIVRLKERSGIFLPQLMQGVAFAVKARSRAENMVDHTDLVCQIICGTTVERVVTVTDECLKIIPTNISSEMQYLFWRESIMNELKQHNRVSNGKKTLS